MIDLKNSMVIHEAGKAKFKPNLLVASIIFVVVILIGQLLGSAIAGVGIGLLATRTQPQITEEIEQGTMTLEEAVSSLITANPNLMSFAMLIATLFTILMAFLVVKLIEKRSFRSMGFQKKGWLADYLKGFLFGAAAIALVGGIAVLLGAMRFENAAASAPWGWIALFLLGFLIQGMSEEVALRGFYMVTLKNRMPMTFAVVFSSVVFALLHLMNSGITPISVLNLILFAVFAGLYFFRTDNIWGIAAFHSAWNFVQGNVLGVLVSGNPIASTIFKLIPVEGKELISGGSFGLEGGLLMPALYIGLILLMIFLPQKPRPEIIETPPAETGSPVFETAEP